SPGEGERLKGPGCFRAAWQSAVRDVGCLDWWPHQRAATRVPDGTTVPDRSLNSSRQHQSGSLISSIRVRQQDAGEVLRYSPNGAFKVDLILPVTDGAGREGVVPNLLHLPQGPSPSILVTTLLKPPQYTQRLSITPVPTSVIALAPITGRRNAPREMLMVPTSARPHNKTRNWHGFSSEAQLRRSAGRGSRSSPETEAPP
ncbi:hypothetical protein BaRGS_00005175, partial [Batillaria attramentaria]